MEETPKKCKDIIKTFRSMLTDAQFSHFGDDPKVCCPSAGSFAVTLQTSGVNVSESVFMQKDSFLLFSWTTDYTLVHFNVLLW